METVADHQVRPEAPDRLDPFRRVLCRLDLVAAGTKADPEQAVDVGGVVDHQHAERRVLESAVGRVDAVADGALTRFDRRW
jgi:hypothetical protein